MENEKCAFFSFARVKMLPCLSLPMSALTRNFIHNVHVVWCWGEGGWLWPCSLCSFLGRHVATHNYCAEHRTDHKLNHRLPQSFFVLWSMTIFLIDKTSHPGLCHVCHSMYGMCATLKQAFAASPPPPPPSPQLQDRYSGSLRVRDECGVQRVIEGGKDCQGWSNVIDGCIS